MTPAGRPPRAAATANKMLRVRLTDDEWRLLEAKARARDLSMSEFVRLVVFGKEAVRGKTK